MTPNNANATPLRRVDTADCSTGYSFAPACYLLTGLPRPTVHLCLLTWGVAGTKGEAKGGRGGTARLCAAGARAARMPGERGDTEGNHVIRRRYRWTPARCAQAHVLAGRDNNRAKRAPYCRRLGGSEERAEPVCNTARDLAVGLDCAACQHVRLRTP